MLRGVGVRTSAVRARGGQDAALASVYAEHGRALLAYARRLTGDDGHAEDVVQEAFLRLWRHPRQLAEDPAGLRPWLFTVARNVAFDAHRARRARPQEAREQTLALLTEDDGFDRALDAHLVADALAALSADHRAVLLETYYRGRSVAEAAASLGVPPGTVKSRTYYALRALRLALQERGVELP